VGTILKTAGGVNPPLQTTPEFYGTVLLPDLDLNK
jgi:hypothetical protein